MSSHKRLTKDELIESLGALGTFNPVGYIVLGFADDSTAGQAASELRAAGFADDEVLVCASSELQPGMSALLRNASGAAGFGYEVTLMRRYLELASQGAGWVVVHAADDDRADKVRAIAERLGARVGVRYRHLASEELIDAGSKRGQL